MSQPQVDNKQNAQEYFDSRVAFIKSTGEYSQAYPHKINVE